MTAAITGGALAAYIALPIVAITIFIAALWCWFKKDYQWGVPREAHGWACRWNGVAG